MSDFDIEKVTKECEPLFHTVELRKLLYSSMEFKPNTPKEIEDTFAYLEQLKELKKKVTQKIGYIQENTTAKTYTTNFRLVAKLQELREFIIGDISVIELWQKKTRLYNNVPANNKEKQKGIFERFNKDKLIDFSPQYWEIKFENIDMVYYVSLILPLIQKEKAYVFNFVNILENVSFYKFNVWKMKEKDTYLICLDKTKDVELIIFLNKIIPQTKNLMTLKTWEEKQGRINQSVLIEKWK